MLTAIAWQPSGAPTIVLWAAPETSPSRRAAMAVPLRWPDRVAGEVSAVALDASALLVAGDTLAAVASCATLSVLGTVVAGGVVGLLLGGGVAGTDSAVDLRLTTASGRAAHRIVRVLST